MATPSNTRVTSWSKRWDPLLGYKYRVSWQGQPVAGVSRVGALRRPTESVGWGTGDSSSTSAQIPGQTTYASIRLERGLIIDAGFERWANQSFLYEHSGALGGEVSLADLRRDLSIELCNQAGQVIKVYRVFNCWPSEFEALPELDAGANAVAIESLTLANEGWQRDDAYAAPSPPAYAHPEGASS